MKAATRDWRFTFQKWKGKKLNAKVGKEIIFKKNIHP